MKFENLIDINKTISKELFEDIEYPWLILSNIEKNFFSLINTLDKNYYKEIEDNIWIGKNVKIDKLSTINPTCIIDDNTEIRAGAYIRGNVIIGKNCVIGNGVELKNSILLDNCHLSHYNYVGNSILGYNVHLGAGVILSNLKNDESSIKIHDKEKIIDTNLRKLGSVIGDNTSIGCNSVVCPGTIVGRNTNIYPLVRIRGYIDSDSIMKSENEIIKKVNR